MTARSTRRISLAVLVCLILAACSGGEPADAAPHIPGLAPGDEVELVEAEPENDSRDLTWTTGLQVEGLPVLSIGLPTEQFLEDAARAGEVPEDYFCQGGNGGYGCDEAGVSTVTGHTFGGPDVLAWTWTFVPEDTAAVRFTDQKRNTFWQRPVHGMVVFPDTNVENALDDAVGPECFCTFEALDVDGEVIARETPEG